MQRGLSLSLSLSVTISFVFVPLSASEFRAERKLTTTENYYYYYFFFLFFVAKLNRRSLRDVHRQSIRPGSERFQRHARPRFHGIYHEAFAARNVHRRMFRISISN